MEYRVTTADANEDLNNTDQEEIFTSTKKKKMKIVNSLLHK